MTGDGLTVMVHPVTGCNLHRSVHRMHRRHCTGGGSICTQKYKWHCTGYMVHRGWIGLTGVKVAHRHPPAPDIRVGQVTGQLTNRCNAQYSLVLHSMYTGHSVQWTAQKVSRVSVDESRPQNYQITAAVIKELWWTCSVMKYDSAAVVWFQDQSMSIIIISAEMPLAIGQTQRRPMEKWEKVKFLQEQVSASGWLGVENHEVYFVQLHHFFAPFSNSNWCGPACAGAAQGQKMGKRSENHPICVKRAENHPICVQWKTVGQVMF